MIPNSAFFEFFPGSPLFSVISTGLTQYMAKKRTMDQLNSSGIENEVELFHGCPRDVTHKISHQGFNSCHNK